MKSKTEYKTSHAAEALKSNLRNLESLSYMKDAESIDVYHAKRLFLGNFYNIDHLYTNDGPNEIGTNDFSRTAIAHKFLFDSAKGEKIKIFAKGLHKNIYDTKIVVEAFRNYAEAILNGSANVEPNDVFPIEVICNGHQTAQILENEIRDLEFSHEAVRLLLKYPGKVSSIIDVKRADPDEKVKIIPLDISTNEDGSNYIEVRDETDILSPGWLSAFSIFGTSYRFRREHGDKNHFALLNFGDPETAKIFSYNFESIKKSSNIENIITI